MRRALAFALALWPLADAAAQGYGQCADRARDRMVHDQLDPAIGYQRALDGYTADLRQCAQRDAEQRARDQQRDDQRAAQERLDQQRYEQQADQQRLDQQRYDRQRQDQQRLDQQRQRQRDDMLRYQQQQR
jgi:hypothetical protein